MSSSQPLISSPQRAVNPNAIQKPTLPVDFTDIRVAGVLMNGAVATLLSKFSGDVNIRSVFRHMLGDTALLANHLSFEYSAWASFRIGMSESASFQIVRRSL